MKLFLDTNVVIDVIAGREPFLADSQAVLNLCERGKAEGFVSALTFCTVAYVLRKNVAPEQCGKTCGFFATSSSRLIFPYPFLTGRLILPLPILRMLFNILLRRTAMRTISLQGTSSISRKTISLY